MPMALAATVISQTQGGDHDRPWTPRSNMQQQRPAVPHLDSLPRGTEDTTPGSSLTETPRSARPGQLNVPPRSILQKRRMSAEFAQKRKSLEGSGMSLSSSGLLSEEAPVPWYIIRTDDEWKEKWDLTMIGLVMITCFTIPFDLAYRDALESGFTTALDVLDYILIVFFGIDFVLCFFVSEQNDGVWITSLRETSVLYVKTWFIIDFLAVFPFDGFSSGGEVLALFKVLRLFRLGKLLKKKDDVVTSNRAVAVRFFWMFLYVALLTHWFGCLLRVVQGLDVNPTTLDGSGEMLQPHWGRMFVRDWYASLCLLLGESLIYKPPSSQVAVVAMITMLVGALVVAALFGQVAMLVASFNISRTRLQEKMDQVNETMKTARLPMELQASVRQYYLYSWMRHKAMNSRTFIDELSPGLRSKTSLFLYQDMLAAVPLFSKAPIAVLEALALCIRAHVYMPSDIIIREGLLGEDMYIIGDGEVQVSLPDGTKVAVLGRGAFFGEIALLSNDQLRHSRVEAMSICDIYSLHKDDMDAIFDIHPKLREEMLAEVKKRKEQNKARFQKAVCGARAVLKFTSKMKVSAKRSDSICGLCRSSRRKARRKSKKKGPAVVEEEDDEEAETPRAAAPPAAAEGEEEEAGGVQYASADALISGVAPADFAERGSSIEDRLTAASAGAPSDSSFGLPAGTTEVEDDKKSDVEEIPQEVPEAAPAVENVGTDDEATADEGGEVGDIAAPGAAAENLE